MAGLPSLSLARGWGVALLAFASSSCGEQGVLLHIVAGDVETSAQLMSAQSLDIDLTIDGVPSGVRTFFLPHPFGGGQFGGGPSVSLQVTTTK